MDIQAATDDPRFGASRPSRSTWRQDWLGNPRGDLLAGLVVALALIPESVVLRFRGRGVAVEVVGLNAASATLLERLGTHDKPSALELAPGH